MPKAALTLCFSALAALAACGSIESTNPPAEARVLAPSGVRPGTGLVESVAPVRSASAGASTGGSAERRVTYRLYLNMDDGHTQAVDVDSPGFVPKDRVQITRDGRVVRVAGGA
jgi:outer membrane lipoprotein SlyB